jgi:hypothetical protein
MAKPTKKLLQTFERTSGGVTGHAVALKLGGLELILVASERDQVEKAAKIAGLGVVDVERIQNVLVLPLHAMADEDDAAATVQ